MTRTPVLSTAAWLATAARWLTTAVEDTLRWRGGWWL